MKKSLPPEYPEIRAGQSIELLKALHILTRDGKMNQDSRRKLKQVYHLYQFIEPLLQEVQKDKGALTLVDHGAGKSYLGFILYDLFFKTLAPVGAASAANASCIYGIETREELVTHSRELAQQLGFGGMSFLNLSVAESIISDKLPAKVDVVTALHACNTATDDAIHFALAQEQRQTARQGCAYRIVAAPDPYPRVWQPPHQRIALFATGGARLSGDSDGTGGLGAFDEERINYCAV